MLHNTRLNLRDVELLDNAALSEVVVVSCTRHDRESLDRVAYEFHSKGVAYLVLDVDKDFGEFFEVQLSEISGSDDGAADTRAENELIDYAFKSAQLDSKAVANALRYCARLIVVTDDDTVGKMSLIHTGMAMAWKRPVQAITLYKSNVPSVSSQLSASISVDYQINDDPNVNRKAA